ncbi:PEP/pyruvate-binding domain-containing protein [Dermatobacter hominis]|uniref:PEP/pyruvate-binding domain-containing protein n=1 Tax=Dermatobacter hominis TaxID=2884263 RepID=UPI001D12106A|nr:PEP/pyruvate-binding domain-containing protein [Dermatobacter hominis]UDY37345.1 hypothetical protein LH044_07350 [Dermatobacter hominis]
MDEPPVLPLDSPRAADGATAGGKAAGLARSLAAGLPVPDGFVVLASADLDDAGAGIPAVRDAYRAMGERVHVAVRSSAVGEDGAADSFAGAHDTVLDVVGADDVVAAVRACRASAASERAVAYRDAKGIVGEPRVAVVVQRMVAATSAGVLFTQDPMGSGGPVIEAVAGRGDVVVGGEASPDPAALTPARREALLALGRRAEAVFGGPQDVEWAIDDDGTPWLLQSRPITALAEAAETSAESGGAQLGPPGGRPPEVLVRGLGASPGVASGIVRVLRAPEDADRLDDGEVLVAPTTSPAWVPAMVRAAAIVTDVGGITSHAAIVARELGVPCVVGTVDGTRRLRDGEPVAVDGSRGLVVRPDGPLAAD